MSTAAFERLAAALADRYRIERELGQGGMATVYLAADLKHDRKVAIKVLKPELAAVLGAERFVQEIKTTAALSHPHILPLFDSGEAGGFLYYVMPYIQGETIREKLNRETQFGIDEAVKIATEVADALDYAHRHGVIHRDIKPENLLLHDGRPMVMDFGIALAVSAAAGGRMTETGLSLGTPHYMSPEQATADKAITARSDIYSLASVLYEMLAGEPPHMGNSAQAIIMKIIAERAQPVTELRASVPPHVAAALGKALEKVPADRFESARAFAEALGNPTFTTAVAGAPSAATAQASARARALNVGLAATAILCAAVAAWALFRPEPPRSVSRYGLALPTSQALVGQDFAAFVLAPDGSWLAYTGPGSRPGETQLWVKARDGLEATPLSGTTGASSPSVSPDGMWIAFFANGQLRKVPAAGGPAATITDSASRGSSLWQDDGVVVYADGLWRLRRVPANGGVPELLFTPSTGLYAVPMEALPKNRGILFLQCREDCLSSQLWVLDGRSGTAKQLLPDVAWATFADGRLLFARRDGAAFGARFDLGALNIDGAPVPLFEGSVVRITGQIARSAAGTLAYLAGGAASGLSEAVWVSRDGQVTPVDTAWSFTANPLNAGSLSPDGKRLAVGLRTDASGDNVWVKELDRGPLSRLTFGALQDIRPRWTPDGRALTFLSNREGLYSVYQRLADGTGSDSLLLSLGTTIYEAFWSSDGQWIVMRTGSDEGRNIYALHVGRDTIPRPLLTEPFDEEAPALSPDGRWLAYVSTETGQREVFVRPFPDVNAGKWQVSTTGGSSPVWAHSGRELFYANGAREMVSLAVLPSAVFARGEQRVLFSLASYRWVENYRFFDISPDDRRFLLLRRKSDASTEEPTLVVVENWLAEVNRIMQGK